MIAGHIQVARLLKKPDMSFFRFGARGTGKRTWLRIEAQRLIGVYRGDRQYHVDGIDIHPVEVFLRELHAGSVF